MSDKSIVLNAENGNIEVSNQGYCMELDKDDQRTIRKLLKCQK